jgi:hypothetical protein
MRPSLYEGYVFLVALASVAGALVCLFGGLHALIGVAQPDWLMRDYAWAYHQTNDRFWEHTGRRHDSDSVWSNQPARPPEDELTRRRLESFEIERATVRHDGWVALVMFGVGLGVSLVMFAVHWRLAWAFRPPRGQALPGA